jgi:hypothetical protein
MRPPPAPARAGYPRLLQDAPHAGPGEHDPLLLQQIPQVLVIGSRILRRGQHQHLLADLWRDGVHGRPAPIAVGQGCHALPPIRRQQPPHLPYRDLQHRRRFSGRHLTTLHPLEHQHTFLFPCRQRHSVLHSYRATFSLDS